MLEDRAVRDGQPGYMRPTLSARWRWWADRCRDEEAQPIAAPPPGGRIEPARPLREIPRYMQPTESSRAKRRPAMMRPLRIDLRREGAEAAGRTGERPGAVMDSVAASPDPSPAADSANSMPADAIPSPDADPETPPRRRPAASVFVTSVDSAADGALGSKANAYEGFKRTGKRVPLCKGRPLVYYLGKENVSPLEAEFAKYCDDDKEERSEEDGGEDGEAVKGYLGSLGRRFDWRGSWSVAGVEDEHW
ncbi:unnamed protein product [Ostreobium quekettii]|uniref:Uncharacterized protein n=1 Tax=Ostreobium quekettii TaxID=121088 RepID=A0A8S1J3C3_9CHLO|nr:unnamed protein product [Ostreobium quekettii]|eukprot:evm.model.scf_250.5 EVM.evm.TU.scf_250.5   scf_250:54518-55829(+)